MQAPSKWPASTPPPNEDVSILVYGCGSSVGQFVLQLLKLAGYTKIFVTASKKHHAFLHELGATHAFDYSSPTLAHDIQKAAGGKITVGIDSISTFRTLDAISQVLEPEGKVAILLPVKDGEGIMDSTSILLQLPADRPTFGSRVEAIYVNVSEYLVKVCVQLTWPEMT
jgi:NADPH:quinone reductase-like Zn-dependent oxidoreductase